MSGLPYFQCYPSDFLTGLSGLSPEEQVVYFTIVLRQYDLGGPVLLRHYERDLRLRSELSSRRLMKVIESLVDRGKLEWVGEGSERGLQNHRAAVEIKKIEQFFDKKRSAAVAGGLANSERIAREKNRRNESGKGNEISESGEPQGKPQAKRMAKPKGEPSGEPQGEPSAKPNQNPYPERTQTSQVDSKPARDLASPSPDRFEKLRAECADALGPDLAPADFVIGPMMLLADEIGRDKLLLILRSERDRPRRSMPRSWSIWAQSVRERLPAYEAAAYSTGMQAPAGSNSSTQYLAQDPDGRFIRVGPPRNSMPWSEFRGHVAKYDATAYWPMSLGPEPRKPGCFASPDEIEAMRAEIKGTVAA